MPGSRSWPPPWSTDCAGAAVGGWRSSTWHGVSAAGQAVLGPFPVLSISGGVCISDGMGGGTPWGLGPSPGLIQHGPRRGCGGDVPPALSSDKSPGWPRSGCLKSQNVLNYPAPQNHCDCLDTVAQRALSSPHSERFTGSPK